jgi:hypothetical protein
MSRLSSHLMSFIVVAVMGSVGCGADYEITEQNLTGTIGGTSWSFVAGETETFASETYFALLFAEDFETCGIATSPTQVNHLIISLPKSISNKWSNRKILV